MKNKSKLALFLILLILVTAFYFKHTRPSNNLNDWCETKVIALHDPFSQYPIATFDFIRFTLLDKKFVPLVTFIMDDKQATFRSFQVLSIPPTYSIQDWERKSSLFHSNINIVNINAATVKKIIDAKTVKIVLNVEGESPKELSVSQDQLDEWKREFTKSR